MKNDNLRAAFVPPGPSAGPARPSRLLFLLLQLVSLFGFAFCLSSLWLGMRSVMDLGGFVAVGGPYVIAHHAPRSVWLIPVSIWVGLFLLFLNSFAARRTGGLSLLGVAWPALFLSLGWNFLEYGVRPPGGGGWAWGWLVCGVLFVLMGGFPLPYFVRMTVKSFKTLRSGRAESGKRDEPGGASAATGAVRGWRVVFLLVQLAAVAVGIYAARSYFLHLNAPPPSEDARESLPASGGGSAPDRAAPVRERKTRETASPGRVAIEAGGYRFEIDPDGRTIILDGMSYDGPESLPPDAGRDLRRASEALLRFFIGADELSGPGRPPRTRP